MKKQVRQWAGGVEPEHLQCRDLRHPWKYHTASRDGKNFKRTLLCTSCSTLKVQILSPRGEILKTKYEYAEGYVRPAGMGRVTKEENALFRLASLDRGETT